MAAKKKPTHHRTAKPVEHFDIVGQTEAPEPQPDGTMEDTWTITFVTPSGVTAYVKVLNADYTAKNVGELVGAAAAEIERVDGLGG